MQIARTGGPDQFQRIDLGEQPPGPGEVRVRTTAIGLNYIDTYHRTGLYPVKLPAVLGGESVGVVEAAGEGVTTLAVGDRVGSYGPTLGGYASHRLLPAAECVTLPGDLDDDTVAATLLKGATVEFLVERCAKVQPGWPVLVWAAAGGVGHLAVQWLHAVGAEVIGVAGGADKAASVKAAGAAHVIDHKAEDVAERVRAITGGKGAPVILDGVGKASWEASLKSVARRGLIVSYGNASGPVEGVNLGALARAGSVFVTRPTLFDYASTPEERQACVDRVFAMLRQGKLTAEIGQRFALADVAEAHRAMEAGETRGSTLLLP